MTPSFAGQLPCERNISSWFRLFSCGIHDTSPRQ
jgi:hypothetical protein